MRESIEETNAHAAIVGKINRCDSLSLRRRQIQPDDRVLGPISEAALRMEVRARQLLETIKEYQDLLVPGIEYNQRERLEHTLDELMFELNFVLGLYVFQVHIELREWTGPAIFRLREHGEGDERKLVVVVSKGDQDKYKKRVTASPFKLDKALPFFRDIILADGDVVETF